MQTMFTYNQQQAAELSTGGNYISETGGYVLKISRAQFVGAQNSKASFLELDFESQDGKQLNYISICYCKKDGSPNDYGNQIIQSIMCITGIQSLSLVQNGDKYECPELVGKVIGGAFQKVLYTKNSGGEGYKFDLKLPYDPKTKMTAKEKITGQFTGESEKYLSTLKDKDDRNQSSSSPASNGYTPADDFDF